MEGKTMRTRKNNIGNANTTRKAKNKRLIALMVAILMTGGPAMAQIFLDDESLTNRGWLGDMDELGNIIPFHEVEWDQSIYVPAGGGIMLLTVLGGAYLIGKRRKEE